LLRRTSAAHDRASSPADPRVCRDRASRRSNDRSDRSPRLNARRARNSYGEASDRASCPDAFPTSCRFAKGNSPGRKTPSVISSCSCRGLRDESGRGCSHLHGRTRARACGRCRGHVTGGSHTRAHARAHTHAAHETGVETRNSPREGGYARCSRVGTRWTTELADVRAPLYIHIYTSHFDTNALLHPLSSGVLLLLLLLPVVAVSAASPVTAAVLATTAIAMVAILMLMAVDFLPRMFSFRARPMIDSSLSTCISPLPSTRFRLV